MDPDRQLSSRRIREPITNFFRENVFSAIGFMILAMGVANLFNYAYNVVAARLLGPERYSEFAALLAVLLILTIPASSLQALITKSISELLVKNDHGGSRVVVTAFLKVSAYGAMILIVLFLAFRGFLASYLHIDSNIPIIVCGITAALTILSPVIAGVLQGFQRFIWLGSYFMTYAFVRILAGSFLIAWGAGVSGAIGGGAIAVIVSVFLAVFVIKDVYSYERSAMEVKAKKFLASFLPIIGAMLILYIIMNIDLIIARRKFIPTIAGDYSCAAFLGKIIFFFPQAIAMVLFPKFFEVKSDQEGLFRLLKKGCFLTVVASLGLSLFFILFPRPLISILYGSDYLGAASILWVFCLSMTGYATVNLLLYYFLSINRLGFMIRIMLLAIVLEILFMYIVASSPFQMASIHLITNAVIFIISFFGIKP